MSWAARRQRGPLFDTFGWWTAGDAIGVLHVGLRWPRWASAWNARRQSGLQNFCAFPPLPLRGSKALPQCAHLEASGEDGASCVTFVSADPVEMASVAGASSLRRSL